MKKLNDNAIARNTAVYDSYYKMQMIDAWENADKAFNFSHMIKVSGYTQMPLEGASVLDVGCGTGDFVPYIEHQGIKAYLGVDIYKPAIELAKQKYPNQRFQVADIIAGDVAQTFDFVFCSGALSINLKETDNYEFLESMVDSMWELTRHGMVFNLMTDEDTDPDPDLFYYSREKVMEICREIAPDARIVVKDTPLTQNGNITDVQIHFYMFR